MIQPEFARFIAHPVADEYLAATQLFLLTLQHLFLTRQKIALKKYLNLFCETQKK